MTTKTESRWREKLSVVGREYSPIILSWEFVDEQDFLLVCSQTKPFKGDQILVLSRDPDAEYSRISELVQDALENAGLIHLYETTTDLRNCNKPGAKSQASLGLWTRGVKTLPNIPAETKNGNDLEYWMCMMSPPQENFIGALLYCRDMYKKEKKQTTTDK